MCSDKCDGKSKGTYIFSSDVEFSEYYENHLIARLNQQGLYANKTQVSGYPLVEVYTSIREDLICYVEVKVQRRSFMSVAKFLPESDLLPSETLALNLSDLLRYFDISKKVNTPTYILWMLAERPCILGKKREVAFFQNVKTLESIYNNYGDKRRFRRKSGIGDIVNGEHKGVVVNYHFSINELKKFSIDQIII